MRTNPFLPNFGARPTLFKSSWSKRHPFERILLFWNAFGPRPTPFRGPFHCVTLGIVSKGKNPSCLWMLPFGPWVLPFGPRVFPIDVLHLPLGPCSLTCGRWILPSNHWFRPTVLGSLVHIKANEKHQAAVQNTRCQRMPSRPKSPPPCRKSTPPFEMPKGPPLSKGVGARPSL